MKMEIVLKIKKENLQKVKDLLLKDDTVSRASVTFKESKGLGFKGNEYFCYISGLEEACNKAKELTKDSAETVSKKEEIIKKIKEEEESAMSGFGSIFG
jgi:nitrogen regulatory protein PII